VIDGTAEKDEKNRMIIAEDERTLLKNVAIAITATETRTTIEGDLPENIEVGPVHARRLDAYEAQSRGLFPDPRLPYLLKTTHIHQKLRGEGNHRHRRQTKRNPTLEIPVAWLLKPILSTSVEVRLFSSTMSPRKRASLLRKNLGDSTCLKAKIYLR
jgi:hypothetical protein